MAERTDLPPLELEVLLHVHRGVWSFIPEGALFLDGPRKRAARRLVKRGLFDRQEYPKSEGYAINESGRAVAQQHRQDQA